MTSDGNLAERAGESGSLLLSAGVPDAAALHRARMSLAEFSRLMQVSRTTVCRWRDDGVIAVGIDNRVDVVSATRSVFQKTDLSRTRSRVLRAALSDVEDVRRAAAQAELREADLRQQLDAATAFADRLARAEDVFVKTLLLDAEKLRATDVAHWPALIAEIRAEAWESVLPAVAAGDGGDDTCLDEQHDH